VPLPSAEDPLDRSAVLAVVRQLARRLGRLPSLEDYEGWASTTREHRPGLVPAAQLMATLGAQDWDELCARIVGR
jgi:hypothetical protein